MVEWKYLFWQDYLHHFDCFKNTCIFKQQKSDDDAPYRGKRRIILKGVPNTLPIKCLTELWGEDDSEQSEIQ